MDNIIIVGLLQGGAIVLLAFVLWQVSLKIDTAMKNMQELLLKQLDMIRETKTAAQQAVVRSDRNLDEIRRSSVNNKK